jgi:small neutral amino acid transporter SnatA (MarC family)
VNDGFPSLYFPLVCSLFFDNAGSSLNKAVLVFLISYVVLVRSNVVLKYLGKTVTKVAVRIMGLMLLSLAMQFIITGILGAFNLR